VQIAAVFRKLCHQFSNLLLILDRLFSELRVVSSLGTRGIGKVLFLEFQLILEHLDELDSAFLFHLISF